MTLARLAALFVWMAATSIAVGVVARRAWLDARTARQGRRVVAEAERLLAEVTA